MVFHPPGWEDYCYWQRENRKLLRRINALIRDIGRDPYGGMGKPEPLRFDLQGCWSRRIDSEHRLVYRVTEDAIHVLACRYHY
ncbi:Txe/YoeB family addiction module toxin [Endothiovibrio diazotrophicus]